MSGIFAVYNKERMDIARYAYYGLYGVQHRGQVCCGLAVNNDGYIDYYKDLGVAGEVFTTRIIESMPGNIALGHVTTFSDSKVECSVRNAQPMMAGTYNSHLALAHDGAIIGADKLRERLTAIGEIFTSEIDAEIITKLIKLSKKTDVIDAIVDVLSMLHGSFATVIMVNNSLICARDKRGVKPLSIGELNETYVVSSETCAIETLGATVIRDVAPGEIIKISEDGITVLKEGTDDCAMCIFEFVYLLRPDSSAGGVGVYNARFNAGRILARESFIETDVVVGAPDSGIIAAIGYAKESGAHYAEGIIKNRYIGRTFIEPTQEIRELKVKIKLNPLKENIAGKSITIIDDSIVRGTTMKTLVKMMKNAGAREVHVRISSPPVTEVCYLGMDTTEKQMLINANMTEDEICKYIGADSLKYISLEGLVEACGSKNYCTGCFTDKGYAIDKEENGNGFDL